MTDDVALTATDLRRSYGDVTALDGVSIDVPTDGVTALIGPNGSGKTTLLDVLLGIERSDAGTVDYGESDARRQVGYLPQRPTFRPDDTVRETIAFYAALVEDDPDRLLERVGLDTVPDRRVSALSGGMTRLLGIAQALAGDPPILALDEPASGLDPAMSDRIFGVIDSLAADGRAVLLTSHALSLVERTADHVVVVEAGGVAARGSPAALRERTGGPLHETFTDLLSEPTTAVDGGDES
ncbi:MULTISPECIES: ABC transporter ATP-binding protein [Halomicrobium]|uniref:ABC transporter related n=2 Tax=Halomicrobium mukohataei TaxID=57705 RepID=C7NXP9_HALMD|nr:MULTISPECIES: ABC transporter ATP-binding protein [Halomicrobium]ACV46487.1 ABC transporter related [Halomicrobium mukohataei DSM 12286]QCD65033.1 ABC transporter ATP-binding protein [Halomicrobium mukohataei]QFR19839.1 ATP-binding cassette domain-containing protein [Halomicrobium sp. ZPS1]